jgi:[protein-PII] uridylyltransferase
VAIRAAALLETTEELAEYFTEERQRIKTANQAAPVGRKTCRALTDLTDAVLRQLFVLAAERPSGVSPEWARSQMAVVATGGYGRRELSPYSDIDVTFVVAEEENPDLDTVVRELFLSLMEVFSQRAQLKVGYSYRTLADCALMDHQTQTALLDGRLLAGSHVLFHEFSQELTRQLWPAAFVRQKLAERATNAAKHGDTIYRVEPQIREGPGGLRDLQVAEWLATVTFPASRGDVWQHLARSGVVSRGDVERVKAAREWLLRLRNWMHFEAGRSADLLARERQELLATALGFQDDGRTSAVERFMEQVYEHAEDVRRVAAFVADRCLRERLSLDEDLVCSGRELAPAYPWLDVASPHFLLTLALHYQQHDLEPGPELRRLISERLTDDPDGDGRWALGVRPWALGVGDDERPPTTEEDTTRNAQRPTPNAHRPTPTAQPVVDPEAGQHFMDLLGARQKVYATLELLVSLGILQRILPEIEEALRRVPADAIHRHTVGHHSLLVVRALEELRESVGDETAEFRRIGMDVEGQDLLMLAALLHDLGKLDPRPGHAAISAEVAEAICRRLGLDDKATGKVVKLVRHHQLMSETSQFRDLTLPQTVRDFIAIIDNHDLLAMLMLLTYADMQATGVLSPVKIRFLEEIFFRAEAALGEQEAPMDDERLQRYRSRLTRQLSGHNLAPEQIREHCEGMPVAYLLNTRPEQMADHIRAVDALHASGPVVEYSSEMGADITTLTLCTYDDPEPGLLSRVAGVLYAHEIAVHAAQVFTRESEPPIALDTLWVDFHGRQLPPYKRAEVAQDLVPVLQGKLVSEILAAHRKTLPPAIPPERVQLDNTLAEHHTVLDIRAPDQPGLLFRITRALAALGWDIHSARISTTGDRARDSFYITDAAGRKLEEEDEEVLVERFLAAFGDSGNQSAADAVSATGQPPRANST